MLGKIIGVYCENLMKSENAAREQTVGLIEI